MELSELVLKENILYESLRFQNLDGTIRTEQKPVHALAVGLPQVLRIPTDKFHKVGDLVAELEKPEPANAYVIGNPGESYQNGFPVAVQFYHKL
ncbi:MAG TPA: hypothetical protein VJJ75_02470 [Candidatus Nanoarchaeia archaeon]|nr:hypothetical protein [Candidatus Nanoarchaeia archaeon]